MLYWVQLYKDILRCIFLQKGKMHITAFDTEIEGNSWEGNIKYIYASLPRENYDKNCKCWGKNYLPEKIYKH